MKYLGDNKKWGQYYPRPNWTKEGKSYQNPKRKLQLNEGLPTGTVVFPSEHSHQRLAVILPGHHSNKGTDLLSSCLPIPGQVSHLPNPTRSQRAMEPTDVVPKGQLPSWGRRKEALEGQMKQMFIEHH